MTRTTRAALRSRELAEESATAAAVPLPLTPQRERVPLGDISDNRGPEPVIVTIPFNEPVKQPNKKGKQGKGGKKGNKKGKDAPQKQDVEVLEDDSQSSASSAVEETRKNLQSEDNEVLQTLPLENETDQIPLSPAAEAVSEELSPKKPTENGLAIEELREHVATLDINKENNAESGTAEIQTIGTAKEVDSPCNKAMEEDSFVKQIKSRSPAKRISRIEDSVEALDVLEEEIEKAAEAIPASKKSSQALHKNNKPSRSPANPAVPKTTKKVMPTNSRKTKPETKTPKPLVSRPSAPSSKVESVKRQPISKSSPKPIRSPSKPLSTAKGGPDKNQTSKPKRVSSVHKAPFQPAKSTKPPTRPAFELPGDAVARRLKEQREERLKRENEETSKQPTFKARPVRLSQAPEVKMTAAAKARLSMANSNTGKNSRSSPPVSSSKTAAVVSSVAKTENNRRMSSLAVSKRISTQGTAATATKTNKRVSSVISSLDGAAAPRVAPTAEDLALQKQKGKAVFARPKNEIAERERIRKEKEDAAKKARIEAAERGRAASRQWAEKQKGKTLGKQAPASEKALAS